jgi:hypothetical protein
LGCSFFDLIRSCNCLFRLSLTLFLSSNSFCFYFYFFFFSSISLRLFSTCWSNFAVDEANTLIEDLNYETIT